MKTTTDNLRAAGRRWQWVFLGWRSWHFGFWRPGNTDALRHVYRWVAHLGPLELRRWTTVSLHATGEERKAFALLARAENDVPKLVAKLGMNGETLAVLHHTHGYDPETVASIVDVPPQMLADYHAAMATERARSRTAQVKEVITVRTTEDANDKLMRRGANNPNA